jgi:hypothetical protein
MLSRASDSLVLVYSSGAHSREAVYSILSMLRYLTDQIYIRVRISGSSSS